MPLKPGQKSPFDISLYDSKSQKEWLLKLDGTPQRDFITDDAQNIYIRNVGKRIGDFDEQRDWKGGMAREYFNDDPTGFFTGSCYTLASNHLLPPLKWKWATGYRTAYSNMTNNVSFRSLTNTQKYITVAVTTGSITADACWIILRRRGNPSDLTLELCSNSAGDPGTVLKTITVSTTTITDIISVIKKMDWTSTEALSAATIYHIKVYGGSTSDDANHWDVGVDTATSNSLISSAGSTWTAASFSLQVRITDADTAQRWFFWSDGTTFRAVSKKDSGNSQIFTLDSSAVGTEVTGHGLGTVVNRPISSNKYHYFPQGESVNIREWDGAVAWADDGSNKATHLVVGYDSADKSVIWRSSVTSGTESTISRANATTGGTNHTFKSDIDIGENTTTISGMYFWTNNGLWVMKSDEVYQVLNDKATKQDFGMSSTPSTVNGQAIIGHKGFLYFNWLFSDERLYGNTLDDIGLGWKGPALPNGMEGNTAGYCTYMGWLFKALDAGTTGTSSVQVWDGLSWHEFFRAPATGMRIRDIAIQVIASSRNVLWIDCGGDLVYITLPLSKANPLYDTSMNYMHEGFITSATIDMGTASKLPKFIRDLTATTANLNGRGIRVECDYQVDDRIGKDGYANWTTINPFLKSPEDVAPIGESNLTQFRYRLRPMTDDSDIPADVKGIVPSGFARGPFRQMWNVSVITGESTAPSGKKVDRDDLDRWLLDSARYPGRVMMTSTWKSLHGYYIIVPPPRMTGITEPGRGKPEKDIYSLTLIEA